MSRTQVFTLQENYKAAIDIYLEALEFSPENPVRSCRFRCRLDAALAMRCVYLRPHAARSRATALSLLHPVCRFALLMTRSQLQFRPLPAIFGQFPISLTLALSGPLLHYRRF